MEIRIHLNLAELAVKKKISDNLFQDMGIGLYY